MATREMVTFKQMENPQEQANLSDTVGVGQRNEKSDVMLIQALLQLVGYSDHHAKERVGVSRAELPEPTGEFDAKTIKAIWGFQRRMAAHLLTVDGKIHPGNYKNRVIKNLGGRLMTITLLNLEALEGALMMHNADVLPALSLVAPQLVLRQVTP